MSKIENLKIYNKALELVVKIYQLIGNNSNLSRDFSLCDQIKRAAVSVPSNISEGYCRSRKQFKNYLEISIGSSNEIVTQLKIIKLVYKIDTIALQEEYDYLGRQITSFAKTF